MTCPKITLSCWYSPSTQSFLYSQFNKPKNTTPTIPSPAPFFWDPHFPSDNHHLASWPTCCISVFLSVIYKIQIHYSINYSDLILRCLIKVILGKVFPFLLIHYFTPIFNWKFGLMEARGQDRQQNFCHLGIKVINDHCTPPHSHTLIYSKIFIFYSNTPFPVSLRSDILSIFSQSWVHFQIK